MPEYGYFLSCEGSGPAELVEQARTAEQAGFQSLWISDHYTWNDAQGQSPFVWSVIGALSEAASLPVETAATSAVMLTGRFRLDVGTGEALNDVPPVHRREGQPPRHPLHGAATAAAVLRDQR